MSCKTLENLEPINARHLIDGPCLGLTYLVRREYFTVATPDCARTLLRVTSYGGELWGKWVKRGG